MSGLLSILIVVLALFALAGAGAGCQGDKPTPTTRRSDPMGLGQWQDMPLNIKQAPVVVTQGPTPLVHIFDVGGPIRVVDLTTGATLTSVTVGDRTLVSVADRNGITVGSQNMVPGPLVAGHQYGIYADPQTSNVMRQGMGVPTGVQPP